MLDALMGRYISTNNGRLGVNRTELWLFYGYFQYSIRLSSNKNGQWKQMDKKGCNTIACRYHSSR
jgi:hypothetical protein